MLNEWPLSGARIANPSVRVWAFWPDPTFSRGMVNWDWHGTMKSEAHRSPFVINPADAWRHGKLNAPLHIETASCLGKEEAAIERHSAESHLYERNAILPIVRRE